jgi:hypothetical protein
MFRIAVDAVAVAVSAVAMAGCGSSGTDLSTSTASTSGGGSAPATTPTTPTGTAPYHPKIDPANFSVNITNTYLPLKPGTTHYYKGVRDGVPTKTVVAVTHQTRTIMGVKCVVVMDNVFENQSLVERTTDWYAQDSTGNVWYFGENTAELQNGVVTTTAGTWEAGVDKALPGIVMEAAPKLGDTFRQEYRPSVALDQAVILRVGGTVTVPAGIYHNVVITWDRNPLDPSKIEHKYYAPGVGFVHAVLKGGGHTEVTSLVR